MRHACKWAELLKSSRHVRAHDANYIMTRNIYIYMCIYIYNYIYTQVATIKNSLSKSV